MSSSPGQIAGYAAAALESLTASQISFIRNLPKAELHAHLNGSIPIPVLQDLLANTNKDKDKNENGANALAIAAASALIDKLQQSGGACTADIAEIGDFFKLFPGIYALTSTAEALAFATRGVLGEFLDGEVPQCAFLELRTTPRETGAGMSRGEYVRVVLGEVERYPAERAALVVSLDRRMGEGVLAECVEIVRVLRGEGRRVVGVDLCGDPTAGDVDVLVRYLKEVKEMGVRVTVHIAETPGNTAEETMKLLVGCEPDRLGHATFLDDAAKEIVLGRGTCIEICLSSNLICKTVTRLDGHHIRYYLEHNHPITICTDDILPFRNSLLGEYALLLAQPPNGLGLEENEVRRIAEMSLECRFPF